MPTVPPHELTAADVVLAVRSGELTRVAVIQDALATVAALNPGIGALVTVAGDTALREAEAADQEGRSRGPLDGVPISVKAEYDVAGLPTSHGNRTLAGNVARVDSPVVERLRAQGAIVIGKANQPDFAMRWNTHSSEIGWTRNPRDLSRSVGGSSGGDAAAVAAGMVAIGFGTDLAGSIRVPAAFCGIYGLRSTPGRVPYARADLEAVRTPAVEVMSSQGPLARSVGDLQLAFEATAGGSIEHPFSIPAAGSRGEASGRLRVARLVDQAGAKTEAGVVEQVDLVCDALVAAGHDVVEAAFPGVSRAPDLWGELLCTELRLRVLPHLAAVMDESCLDHIDTLSRLWPTITDTDTYLARWEELSRMRRRLARWQQTFPLIVSPVAGRAVPLPLEYDHWANSESLSNIVEHMRNSLWPACLGLPALGLANGVQLVAGPHCDETMFAPARAAEQRLPACLPRGCAA